MQRLIKIIEEPLKLLGRRPKDMIALPELEAIRDQQLRRQSEQLEDTSND